MASALVREATATTVLDGWFADTYPATYDGLPPETPMGSAHLPIFVRATIDEDQIAVRGWDIFTPERDEILLSMLLSTTWESPLEPWQDGEEWMVSTLRMPMSDGSEWLLWFRNTEVPSIFELGAPRFLDPQEVPQYTITDQRQRHWSFAQPLIAVPEPSPFVLAALTLALLVARRGRGVGTAHHS